MTRLAALLSFALACTGCPRDRTGQRADVAPPPPPFPTVEVRPRDAGAPRVGAQVNAARCNPLRPLEIATGWRAVGWRPGPALRGVIAVGARGRTLVATTAETVCVSRDEGRSWSSPLGETVRLAAPEVSRMSRAETLALIAQGTGESPAAPRVMLSRDDGDRWTPLTLPPAAGPEARVFTDNERTVFVASPTQLWSSVDGRAFEGPRTLPGERADRVDLCGDTLIARARMGVDFFHHRSDDLGRSWRAFRLGAIGLEGNDVRVRCLGWRGGIEAGVDPLPRSWSFDGGHAWERADYDAKAQRAARQASNLAAGEAVLPHCGSTPGGVRVCVDRGRARIGDREVHAPMDCEHLRVIDDQRVVAFGPTCGAFISSDLGGVWRPLITPLRAEPGAGAGAGGFLSRDVAWRVGGGIWWTEDGGARWRLAPTVHGRTVERGVFVDAARGVFVRADGWVMSTQDGGRTWSYVTRGEGVRIASAGRWVMVTTADRARASADGGETWRANATIPANIPLDHALVVSGSQRRVDPAPGMRVQQQGDRVEVLRGGEALVLARALPEHLALLAAHADAHGVDRVLLSEGVVLHRAPRAGRHDAGAAR
jgi:hypothetical protein